MQRATPSCMAAETTRLACTWSIYPPLPPAARWSLTWSSSPKHRRTESALAWPQWNRQNKTVPHRHSGDVTKLITQASTGQHCHSQRPSAPHPPRPALHQTIDTRRTGHRTRLSVPDSPPRPARIAHPAPNILQEQLDPRRCINHSWVGDNECASPRPMEPLFNVPPTYPIARAYVTSSPPLSTWMPRAAPCDMTLRSRDPMASAGKRTER
jgi:hypothetical protein